MAGQGSARVTLREIDLSQVKNPEQLPQGVPAAVVGPARKGPAFVPRTFANMQQFNEVFGNMLEVGREGNSNQFGPLAINEWMKSAQAGTYVRVLGVGNGLASNGGKVTDAGFVGIATTTPSEVLSVSGSINVFGEAGHITASGNISASGGGYFTELNLDGTTYTETSRKFGRVIVPYRQRSFRRRSSFWCGNRANN